jgi:isopropylmalate/homocitrate/citramalate synthase
MSRRITVVEVGPRDGLQSIGAQVETADKIRYIDALSRTGLPVIEVTSFVSARWVPPMADADEVLRGIRQAEGVRYPVLVPNEKGLDRAMQAGAREIAVFTAASESFNRNNINAGIAESLDRLRPVVERARAAGLRVRGYISTCWGCPYEGEVAASQVVDVARDLQEMEVDEISAGDTIGVATPNRVEEVLAALLPVVDAAKLAVHFHDTYGMGLANVEQALRMGIATFDTSSAGIGGCPYAPGATGNLATEDLVYLLHGRGLETGVNLEALVEAGSLLEEILGHPVPGRAYRALSARHG